MRLGDLDDRSTQIYLGYKVKGPTYVTKHDIKEFIWSFRNLVYSPELNNKGYTRYQVERFV